MEQKKYLTAAEAERLYGISRWTLYAWAAQRRIASHKIGKLRRFALADLERFFQKNRVNPIVDN